MIVLNLLNLIIILKIQKNKNKKYHSMNIINLSNFNYYSNNIQVKSNKFYVNTFSTNNTDIMETKII